MTTLRPRYSLARDWLPILVCGIVLFVILPQVLSSFQINLLGRFLTYAIVALGLDLIWGYTGMMSLGQGLFFGLGAYCFAMYLNLEAAGKNLPEFMPLYGVTELPWLWQPFHSPIVAIILAIVVPMLVAGLLGFMVFRSRVQGVYFSIITQALTAIVALLLVGQQQLINGTNGITEMRTILGYKLSDPNDETGAVHHHGRCIGRGLHPLSFSDPNTFWAAVGGGARR
jgi:urea transport system permease protein